MRAIPFEYVGYGEHDRKMANNVIFPFRSSLLYE